MFYQHAGPQICISKMLHTKRIKADICICCSSAVEHMGYTQKASWVQFLAPPARIKDDGKDLSLRPGRIASHNRWHESRRTQFSPVTIASGLPVQWHTEAHVYTGDIQGTNWENAQEEHISVHFRGPSYRSLLFLTLVHRQRELALEFVRPKILEIAVASQCSFSDVFEGVNLCL